MKIKLWRRKKRRAMKHKVMIIMMMKYYKDLSMMKNKSDKVNRPLNKYSKLILNPYLLIKLS